MIKVDFRTVIFYSLKNSRTIQVVALKIQTSIRIGFIHDELFKKYL